MTRLMPFYRESWIEGDWAFLRAYRGEHEVQQEAQFKFWSFFRCENPFNRHMEHVCQGQMPFAATDIGPNLFPK